MQTYRIMVCGVLYMSVNTYEDLWRSMESGDLRSATEGLGHLWRPIEGYVELW